MSARTKDRIDCIIPYYNGREFLADALSSVAAQTMADAVDVTVVDDASPDGGCADVLARFAGILSVRALRLEKNGGQGMARQYGIDHTQNPFVTFMDQDDTLTAPFSLEVRMREMERFPTCNMVMARTFMPKPGRSDIELGAPIEHNGWMNNKIYRRAGFVQKGIRFGEGEAFRQNEDAGFNGMLYLVSGEREIRSLQSPVYCWRYNLESTSRKDSLRFDYQEGMEGYANNGLRALEKALADKVEYKRILSFALNYLNVTSKTAAAAAGSPYASAARQTLLDFYRQCCQLLGRDVMREKEIEKYDNLRDLDLPPWKGEAQ